MTKSYESSPPPQLGGVFFGVHYALLFGAKTPGRAGVRDVSPTPVLAAVMHATTALSDSTLTGASFLRVSFTTLSSCESLRGSPLAASSTACLAFLAAGLGLPD